jgi:hypothetical protein
MIRKSELERAISSLQIEAQKIGLKISECVVLNKNIIQELEKCDSRYYGLIKKKPIFVSKKNYNTYVTGEFADEEFGRIFGIKLVKGDKNGERGKVN